MPTMQAWLHGLRGEVMDKYDKKAQELFQCTCAICQAHRERCTQALRDVARETLRHCLTMRKRVWVPTEQYPLYQEMKDGAVPCWWIEKELGAVTPPGVESGSGQYPDDYYAPLRSQSANELCDAVEAHLSNGHAKARLVELRRRLERTDVMKERDTANDLLRHVGELLGKQRHRECSCNRCRATAAISAHLNPQPQAATDTLEGYYSRQIEWSRKTFGPGKRTGGILQHIRKELLEIEAEPTDLSEWIDVVILAMDGYWRHGGTEHSFMPYLLAKQRKNFAREWPTPTSEDEAVEHVRNPQPKDDK